MREPDAGCALQSDASALVCEPLVQQRARKDVSVGSSMLFEPGKRGDANVELRHGASSCHSCSPVRPIPQDNANGHCESLEAPEAYPPGNSSATSHPFHGLAVHVPDPTRPAGVSPGGPRGKVRVYVGSSIVLSHILRGHPALGAVSGEVAGSSDLLVVGCYRVLQRERMSGNLDDR